MACTPCTFKDRELFLPPVRTESQSAETSQAVWPLTLCRGVVRLDYKIPAPIPQSTLVGGWSWERTPPCGRGIAL